MIATPTKDTTAEQQTNAVNQGFSSQITPVNPPSPIPADGLSTPASNPIPSQTTTPVDLNTSHGVGAPTGTTTDANGVATIPPPTPEKKTAYQAMMEKISGFGEQLGLKSQAIKDAENEAQLSQKRETATRDYNAYNQKKLEYQQNIEAMRARSGGLTGGLNEEIDSYSRRANADLANLAIQAQSSQGLLDSAKATIKDKIDAQFQPIQDQIDFYTKFLQANNNDLTESEKFKLTEAQNQKKTELANLSQTADDLHKNMLQNGAPASAFTALDKITNDYVAGKITATDAQTKLYQVAGQYGVDTTKILEQIKLRQDIANGNPNLSGDDRKEMLSGDVQDVLTGRNTIGNIRLQMGRTKDASQYLTNMRAEIRKIDPNFDFVASDAGSKFVSSTYYQKSISAINNVLPDIKIATDLSEKVGRLGIKGVDNLLQKGGQQINNKNISNLKEAQLLLADSIGIALGQGTVSDMKLQLGFDVTDPSVSADVFFSNMGIVKQFLENRKKGLEDQRYKSSTVGTENSQSPIVTAPDGQQVIITD